MANKDFNTIDSIVSYIIESIETYNLTLSYESLQVVFQYIEYLYSNSNFVNINSMVNDNQKNTFTFKINKLIFVFDKVCIKSVNHTANLLLRVFKNIKIFLEDIKFYTGPNTLNDIINYFNVCFTQITKKYIDMKKCFDKIKHTSVSTNDIKAFYNNIVDIYNCKKEFPNTFFNIGSTLFIYTYNYDCDFEKILIKKIPIPEIKLYSLPTISITPHCCIFNDEHEKYFNGDFIELDNCDRTNIFIYDPKQHRKEYMYDGLYHWYTYTGSECSHVIKYDDRIKTYEHTYNPEKCSHRYVYDCYSNPCVSNIKVTTVQFIDSSETIVYNYNSDTSSVSIMFNDALYDIDEKRICVYNKVDFYNFYNYSNLVNLNIIDRIYNSNICIWRFKALENIQQITNSVSTIHRATYGDNTVFFNPSTTTRTINTKYHDYIKIDCSQTQLIIDLSTNYTFMQHFDISNIFNCTLDRQYSSLIYNSFNVYKKKVTYTSPSYLCTTIFFSNNDNYFNDPYMNFTAYNDIDDSNLRLEINPTYCYVYTNIDNSYNYINIYSKTFRTIFSIQYDINLPTNVTSINGYDIYNIDASNQFMLNIEKTNSVINEITIIHNDNSKKLFNIDSQFYFVDDNITNNFLNNLYTYRNNIIDISYSFNTTLYNNNTILYIYTSENTVSAPVTRYNFSSSSCNINVDYNSCIINNIDLSENIVSGKKVYYNKNLFISKENIPHNNLLTLEYAKQENTIDIFNSPEINIYVQKNKTFSLQIFELITNNFRVDVGPYVKTLYTNNFKIILNNCNCIDNFIYIKFRNLHTSSDALYNNSVIIDISDTIHHRIEYDLFKFSHELTFSNSTNISYDISDNIEEITYDISQVKQSILFDLSYCNLNVSNNTIRISGFNSTSVINKNIYKLLTFNINTSMISVDLSRNESYCTHKHPIDLSSNNLIYDSLTCRLIQVHHINNVSHYTYDTSTCRHTVILDRHTNRYKHIYDVSNCSHKHVYDFINCTDTYTYDNSLNKYCINYDCCSCTHDDHIYDYRRYLLDNKPTYNNYMYGRMKYLQKYATSNLCNQNNEDLYLNIINCKIGFFDIQNISIIDQTKFIIYLGNNYIEFDDINTYSDLFMDKLDLFIDSFNDIINHDYKVYKVVNIDLTNLMEKEKLILLYNSYNDIYSILDILQVDIKDIINLDYGSVDDIYIVNVAIKTIIEKVLNRITTVFNFIKNNYEQYINYTSTPVKLELKHVDFSGKLSIFAKNPIISYQHISSNNPKLYVYYSDVYLLLECIDSSYAKLDFINMCNHIVSQVKLFKVINNDNIKNVKNLLLKQYNYLLN